MEIIIARKKFLFIFILLVSAATFAVCIPAKESLYVPAVVNENYSEMIKVTAETKAGSGEAYISVGPTIGTYTQESEKIAASVAYGMAGNKDCDILLKIDTPESVSKIDGPSAGAAMTLLMVSAMEGKHLRPDFSITGTIEEDGTVGSVGGIPLKAEAVAGLEKKLFIVPMLDSTDKALLLIMQREYDITAVQVETVGEAYAIARNTSMPTSNIILVAEPMPDFANRSLNHSYSGYFMNLTERMISETEDIVDDVGRGQPTARENMRSRLEIAEAAKDSGNYYTAANTAFLLAIDSSLLDYSESNFGKHLVNVQECIDEYSLNGVVNSSLDNFELAGAANLRYLWAKKKMPSNTDLNDIDTLSMKLQTYSNMLYSESWCYAARDMSSYSHSSGNINMSKAKEVAGRLIERASDNESLGDDPDLAWHLAVAEKAYDDGMYVEAIIDSNFVLAGESISKLNGKPLRDAEKELLGIVTDKGDKNYSFLWPQVYRNHGKTFEDTDAMTAARLYLLADGLESSFSEVRDSSLGQNQTSGTELDISSIPPGQTVERPPAGETRTVFEPEPYVGWDLRYLIYIIMMLILGYIIQHWRSKRGKEKEIVKKIAG